MATVEVEGLDKLILSLDYAIANFNQKADEVMKEIAREIERKAKEFVHVRTGALRDSIKVETRRELEAAVSMLYYGFYLEYGTVRMPPYPFIRPALEQIKPHVSEVAWKHLKQLFRR